MSRRRIRTFLDSGVLIAAFKGQPSVGEPAARVLRDAGRLFLSSPFVELEVCPKALFHRYREEHAFYQAYFARTLMTYDFKAILRVANGEVSHFGLGPMDALHVAAARLLKADEFITTEKPAKSIHRTSLLKVVYLFG